MVELADELTSRDGKPRNVYSGVNVVYTSKVPADRPGRTDYGNNMTPEQREAQDKHAREVMMKFIKSRDRRTPNPKRESKKDDG